MKAVIIDYRTGNVASLRNALHALGAEVTISHDPQDILNTDRLFLPGVGAFATGMDNLNKSGLVEPLIEAVTRRGVPLLGICLGMQLLASESLENGHWKGLGLVSGVVERLSSPTGLRLPHMGWNSVQSVPRCSFLDGLGTDPDFYFVHSYHLRCENPDHVAATCDYGERFAAVVSSGNIHGVQFHPEKSHRKGLAFLGNFLFGAKVDTLALADCILKNALSDDRLHRRI